MVWLAGVRPWMLAAAAAGLVIIQGCAPVTRVIDTPKDGARIDLTVEQGMQVRWSNLSPNEGTWALESNPKTAVVLMGKTEQPASGGGIALDIFDFKAKQKGADRLTFVYRHKDGSPASAEDRISLDLQVG